MSEDAPRVAAVVVNWNSGGDLVTCLESLRAQTCALTAVIVVDNASRDDSLARALARFPDLNLLALPENRGFAGGANEGIRAAGDVDAVLVLNPDAWPDPDFLERALPALQEPGVGFVAPKLLRTDRRTIDSAGQRLSPVLRRVLERGYGKPDRGEFDRPCAIPSVCGAAALYGRALLARLAPDGRLYDEDFFAFWEDADVGARAGRAGLRGRYQPLAVAVHRRGGTRPRERHLLGRAVQMLGRDDAVRYHILKNRYLFLAKNEPIAGLLLRAPALLAADGAVLLATALLRPRLFARLLGMGPLLRRAWAKRGTLR